MAESCPKCGTARDETRKNCRTCGLAAEKMLAFEKLRDAVPEALTTAWDRVLEKWDDEAHHDEVLRLATQHDAYAWAAARYRERAKQHGDDPIATEQLDRVRRAAEVTMTTSAATRAANAPEPYRTTMVILGIVIIIVLAGLVYAMARNSGGDDDGATDIKPPGPPAETK